MGYLAEKVAYLKGLCDGVDINESSKEGKILKAIIETLGELADEVEAIAEDQMEMQDQVDDMENELVDLADDFYGDFDISDDDEDWEDDEEEYSFQCPKCGEMVYMDLDMLESDDDFIICPNCKEKITLEFDCDFGVDCSDCDENE